MGGRVDYSLEFGGILASRGARKGYLLTQRLALLI